MPGATQDLDGLGEAEPVPARASRSCPVWLMVGRYARKIPPGRSAVRWRRTTTSHGSGRSSTTRSRSRLADAFGDVTDLHPVVDVVAELVGHIGLRPARRSPPGSRSRPPVARPGAGPSTAPRNRPRPRGPAGPGRCRPQSGWRRGPSDRSPGPPRHLQRPDVGQRRPEHQELPARRAEHRRALGPPMMSSWARMPAWVWKLSPGRSLDEVSALFRVDQQHPLAVGQPVAVATGTQPGNGSSIGSPFGERIDTSRRSPALTRSNRRPGRPRAAGPLEDVRAGGQGEPRPVLAAHPCGWSHLHQAAEQSSPSSRPLEPADLHDRRIVAAASTAQDVGDGDHTDRRRHRRSTSTGGRLARTLSPPSPIAFAKAA